MENSAKFLSDIIVYGKYARYLESEKRRENWHELVTRNKQMHISKYPNLKDEIEKAYEYVYDKKILPSMRSLQFGGAPIELNHSRVYNCAFAPVDHPDTFSEIMFLLLGGTGMGFSVQKHHVEKLPLVQGPKARRRKYLIGDSIEGWADAVKVLFESYFYNKSTVVFDFGDIRKKGARLITSGGKAPGPQPLKDCLYQIEKMLSAAVGRQLRPIEVHDMVCFIADAVLAGGIRRAALISLFSPDDMDMLTCKSGFWWELNPQRGRANNSAVLERGKVTEDEFKALWAIVKASGAGEPGFYWTNDAEWGTNPCCEIALKPFQFCNLVEVNASDVVSQEDLEERARRAAFIGTLQASYTNFHYLREIWQTTTEEDALIGVGMTGIADGAVLGLDLGATANVVKLENERVAAILGINAAARTTTVKPSGTTSCVLGTASGIHSRHAKYYIRTTRIGKNEPLYGYLLGKMPKAIEDCLEKPHLQAVINFPQMSPDGSILRDEGALDFLARIKRFNVEWVKKGHRRGANTNNVSATVSVRENEWDEVADWMWENRDTYNGLSVLPYDGGTYSQAPFQECSKERFEELDNYLQGISIDLRDVLELEDNTDLTAQAACAGGACEVVSIESGESTIKVNFTQEK